MTAIVICVSDSELLYVTEIVMCDCDTEITNSDMCMDIIIAHIHHKWTYGLLYF